MSTNWWINKVWTIILPQKEWSTKKYYNMDNPWKRYAKWKKADKKPHIPFIWNVHNRQIQRQKVDLVIARGLGEWEWEVTVNVYKFSLWWICSGIREWWWMHDLVNILKNTEVYTSKRVNFITYELYLNKAVIFKMAFLWSHIFIS